MKRLRKLSLLGAAGAVLALGGVIGGGAMGAVADGVDNQSGALDPTGVMAQLAPSETTAPSEDGSVAVTPSSSGSSGAEATVSDVSSHAAVDLQLPRSTTYVTSDGDYSVFKDQSTGGATWIKPASDGGQVVFYADRATGLTNLSVTFAQGIADHYPGADGATIIRLDDGETLALFPAWARDAVGTALETDYVINGDTITQRVQTTDDTVYPVVADPAWSYTAHYDVATTSTATAKKALHRCFSCYFPVPGAPKTFPSPGTSLPLTVGLWNFHCIFRSEYSDYSQGVRSWGYTFDAAKGHVDGLGSHISFTFSDQRDGNHYLDVYAYIKNSDPAGIGQGPYTAGALVTWQQFSISMRNAK